jgi:hypothetical protein
MEPASANRWLESQIESLKRRLAQEMEPKPMLARPKETKKINSDQRYWSNGRMDQ